MKKYSNKTYYKYVRRLLEEDSTTYKTIKADDPQIGKIIAGASAGGVGAIACLKYLDTTFSISSLDTAIKQLSKIAKDASKDGTGIFKRVLGKLSSMIGTALDWVKVFSKGAVKKFPSLAKPIFSGSSMTGVGSKAPTYGSVFCMALAAAAVGAVLYKIYKFIKGKRKKTESIAMYNFRKNYELSVMLDETTMFFNTLNMLIEAGAMDSLRDKFKVASKDAAKAAEKAAQEKRDAIYKAIDNTDRGMGNTIAKDMADEEARVAAIDRSGYNSDQWAGKQMDRNAAAAQAKTNNYNKVMSNQEKELTKMYQQQAKDQATKTARDNAATAGMRQKGINPETVKQAQTKAALEKARKVAAKLEKKQTTQLSGYGQKSAYDIYNQAIHDPNYTNSPELQKVAAQARQMMNKPEAVEYTVRPLKDGRVSISTYSNIGKDNGSLTHGQRIKTIAVSKAEADNLIKLSKKSGFDPVTISDLSKNHSPAELKTILNSASKNGMDPKELSAMANRYKGNPDPNAARMGYSKVSQDTLDKIQATKIKNTSYMQMSNGKVSALYTDPVTGEKISKVISKAEVPKGASIVDSPRLQKINAKAAADKASLNFSKTAPDATERMLQKSKDAAMAQRYAGPDVNAVRAGAFGKAGEASDAMKGLASKKADLAQKMYDLDRGRNLAQKVAADATNADANVFTGLKTATPKAKIASVKFIQQSDGKVLAIGADEFGNEIKSKIIPKSYVPKGRQIINSPKVDQLIKQSDVTNAGKAVGESTNKAEGFIDSVKRNADEMWKNSKTWCKNNTKLLTIVAIIVALIACWFGVKKYRASKAKKRASQQATLATA